MSAPRRMQTRSMRTSSPLQVLEEPKRQRRAKKAATPIPAKRQEGAPDTTGITPAGERRIAGEPLPAAPSPTIDGMVDFKLTPYEVRLILRRRAQKALEAASTARGEGGVSSGAATAQPPTLPRKRSAPVDADLESEQSARVLRQRLSPPTRSRPTGVDCPAAGSTAADDVVPAAPSPLPRGGASGADKRKRAPADDGSVSDLADLTDGESGSDLTDLADLSDPEDPTSRHYAGAGFLAGMGMTPKATEPAHPTKRVRLGPAIYDGPTHSPKPNARPTKSSLRRNVPAGPSEPVLPLQVLLLKKEYRAPPGFSFGLSDSLLDDSCSDINVTVDADGLIVQLLQGRMERGETPSPRPPSTSAASSTPATPSTPAPLPAASPAAPPATSPAATPAASPGASPAISPAASSSPFRSPQPASDAPDDGLFAAADLDGDGCDSFALRLLRAARAAAGRGARAGVRRRSSLQPGSPGSPLAASPLGLARAQPGQYRPRRASGLRLATDEAGDSVLFSPRQAFVPAVYDAVRSRWTREAAEPTIAGYRARFAALLPRPN
ncbi:MAG: hypothetical protein M1826_004384 [Phylliscum demangeonii]|nr:MAG: hypothetical protein M1826_004384 [Phylliscum demangeonii]